ncbi:MAG: acyl-CoA dehydrogenase family protein [Frankia sp.]
MTSPAGKAANSGTAGGLAAADVRAATARLRAGGPRAVIEAARALAPTLVARAERDDRTGAFPAENIAAIWAAGLGNLTIPVKLGGVGTTVTATARAVEALGGADPASALILVMHLAQHLVMDVPELAWPTGLRRRLAEDSLDGPALVNNLRVEPDLGTPARGGVPATRATPVTAADGSPGWRVSGRKIYSTGSTGLAWMIVHAATADTDPDGVRIGSFLVPGGAAGVEVIETWDHLGLRASASHDVVFHEVEIPADHAVRLEPADSGPATGLAGGPGAQAAYAALTVLIGAIYTGVARSARDWVVGFLNERVPTNLGAPLATLPRFQEAVGEMEALIYDSDRLVFGLAEEIDTRPDALTGNPGLVKVLSSRNVIATVEAGLKVTGNPGLTMTNPLQRHHRDALCSRVHTPQEDAVLVGTGRASLARHSRPNQ